MTEYDDTNRGALWKNEKAHKETDPILKGNANIEGVECWAAAWRVTSDNERAPTLRLSFTPKDKSHAAGMQEVKEQLPGAEAEFDDDLPF